MTHEEIREKFRLVDEFIESLQPRDSRFDGEAVNWGDIGMVELNRVEPLLKTQWGMEFFSDSPYLEIVLEEAGPESTKFCNVVQEYAQTLFDLPVAVRSQW